MINALKNWFDELGGSKSTVTDQATANIDLCCFSLMVITASVDSAFDPSERQTIEQLGRDLFDLDNETIAEILKDAKTQAGDSTSLYEFTSLIHEHMSENEKFKLVEGLWKIAFADGQVDKYEEHIIRRVAELIYLDHARFTEARYLAETQSQ
jgi:uncharacterized tellurite resistance protein B-like protein